MNFDKFSPADYDLDKAYRSDYERQAIQDHLAEITRDRKSSSFKQAVRTALATIIVKQAFPANALSTTHKLHTHKT